MVLVPILVTALHSLIMLELTDSILYSKLLFQLYVATIILLLLKKIYYLMTIGLIVKSEDHSCKENIIQVSQAQKQNEST